MQLEFPIAGLNRSTAFQNLPPYSCYDALNVWPREPTRLRGRGGSRPGLALITPGPAEAPWRLFETIHVKTNDRRAYWSDSFNYSSMSHYSTLPNVTTLIGPTSVPSVSDGMAYATPPTTSGENRSFVLPTLTGFDSTAAFRFGVYLLALDEYETNIRLFFNMTAGGDANNSYYVYFANSANTNPTYACRAFKVTAGSAAAEGTATATVEAIRAEGWLEIEVSGTSLKVYWRGTQIYTRTLSVSVTNPGLAVTMQAISSTGATSDYNTYIDRVRVQYYKTSDYDMIRPVLVASQSGIVYKDSFAGKLTASAATRTLASDRHLMAASYGQLLYIADHSEPIAAASNGVISGSGTSFDSASYSNWTTTFGSNAAADNVVNILTDGASEGSLVISSVASGSLTVTGGTDGTSLSFRVERSPKIYDPVNDTLTLWRATASKGTVPVGCSIIVRHLGRLFLAGDPVDPNEWYASRLGDPNDWLFSDTDEGAATKGSNAEAYKIGDVIIGMIPYADHFMLFGCRSSFWRLTGDVTAGGEIAAVSFNVGLASSTSWCHSEKAGEVFILSPDGGVYATRIDCPNCDLVRVSGDRLPQEFRNLLGGNVQISMTYDVANRGLHIWLTPNVASESVMPTPTHWFFDIDSKGFFPVQYADKGANPVASLWYPAVDPDEACVLLAGFNGDILRYAHTAETDCLETLSSHVLFGPLMLGAAGHDAGMVAEMVGNLAESSGNVTWSLYVGKRAENVVTGSAVQTGTFAPSTVRRVQPRRSGGAFALKLSATGRWAMESVDVTRVAMGALR